MNSTSPALPRPRARHGLAAWLLLSTATALGAQPTITLESLLREMSDPDALTRFPRPAYRSLQVSSYNRESVHRDRPGWFADSDGIGFLREQMHQGTREWVILDHEGPGCLTRIWTPFFYYQLEDHKGPNVRVYLDGASTPVVDESLIEWVTGKGSVPPPWASFTARAGDLYLPIPFARGCRVTLTAKPFYYIINYRAYPRGTQVRSFSREAFTAAAPLLSDTARHLLQPGSPEPSVEGHTATQIIAPKTSARLSLPNGPHSVVEFAVQAPDLLHRPAALRSTVLSFTFDGQRTVWCPLGDFFGCADSVHPYQTWQRTVRPHGRFVSRWHMPYAKSAVLELTNLGDHPLDARIEARVQPRRWDRASLHFHAAWRPDDVVPGTPFTDWNFVDIRGRGVYVGDAWTVLNPQRNTWWGEGDEKIYVDDAWDEGFPTHFGTGTEDYYGWAGGVLPTRADEFSHPFLANIRVGGLDGHTQGFNICTRTRGLDAIPFTERLRFDMESSFGTDIRNPWDLLGYSAVTFWYATPGTKHNRPAQPDAATKPVLSLDQLKRKSDDLRHQASTQPKRPATTPPTPHP